jgi:hypothetical protein
MSIELPDQVVWLLNLIGVNWPNVDEDQVRLFGQHVRTFASNIDDTHQAASATINQMNEAYSGASYEQLMQTWGRMSKDHMNGLVDACHVAATALDGAADVIVGAKVAAIGELVALAASFVADQAAAVATFGAAEAAEALVVTAAKKVVNGLTQQLEQHILGEVIQKAVEPLERTVERAMGGLVFKGVEDAVGVSGADAAGSGFGIVPDALLGHATKLHSHADEVANHAQTFAHNVAGVSFGG